MPTALWRRPLGSAPHAAVFLLHMLEWGAKLAAVQDDRIIVETKNPGGGTDVDLIEAVYLRDDISTVARAVQYWCRLRDRKFDDRERDNWQRCAIRAHVYTYADQFAWAQTHAQMATDRLRVAVMLACGIDRIEDLEAGLAIAACDGDPDRDFIAAVELWCEVQTQHAFRDCAALAA
jgi:hypothetical protein